MIGKRSKDTTLFDVGNVWPLELKPASFHYQLAIAAPTLFKDEEFAALYCGNNGRPSVPPSQLALLLILQSHSGASDAEAVERTACDLRWAAVLGRHAGMPLCAKSTLQMFRHQMILHKEFQLLIRRSIEEARAVGLIRGHELTVALDTKPMIGAGAVQDTYNLLAQGMRDLIRALARESRMSIKDFLATNGLEDLNAPSIKGSVSIDWSDEQARDAFLTDLVGHARKLLTLANGGNRHIKRNAELLEQLIIQDVQERAEGNDDTDDTNAPSATIIQGTAHGRIPSATDPEQRHGRKSHSKKFTGHKSEIVTDTDSGIILHADILAGDAADDTDALKQIKAAEATAEACAGATIAATIGDCAYGSRSTRQEFADAGRDLIAKVPRDGGNKDYYPKSRFVLTMLNDQVVAVTCPGGYTTDLCTEHKDKSTTFYFDQYCGGCSLKLHCTGSEKGRSVSVHAQEAMLQAARSLQNSPDGRYTLRKRLIVENALGRLAHYGIGQARYLGREKSRFQLVSACCVANLRRCWNFALRSAAQLPSVTPQIPGNYACSPC
jgi:hypothetical protein